MRFKVIFCTLIFSVSAVFAQDDYDIKFGDDTAIISNVCLYAATDGVNKIVNITSEDAGLKITLVSDDHATELLYDATGEIEPITTFGTWLAPSASNIRFEVDTVQLCYEFQFAVDSFEDGTSAKLTIEDTSSPTFMDKDVQIHILGADEFDRIYGVTSQLSALDTGLVEGPTTIATLTTQLDFTLTDGATNNDAYNDHPICFIGGTEKSCVEVSDYVGGTKQVILKSAPAFTIAVTTDPVRIFQPGMIFTNNAIEAETDKIAGVESDAAAILDDTGVNGVVLNAAGLQDDAITEIIDAMPMVMETTTIATLATQVSFTLTAGSPDDDAYNGCAAITTDVTTATQKAYAGIQDYAKSTKTITLDADPGIFVMAATDLIDIVCLPTNAQFFNNSEVLGTGKTGDLWRGNP